MTRFMTEEGLLLLLEGMGGRAELWRPSFLLLPPNPAFPRSHTSLN
jgi:hypothetical protein